MPYDDLIVGSKHTADSHTLFQCKLPKTVNRAGMVAHSRQSWGTSVSYTYRRAIEMSRHLRQRTCSVPTVSAANWRGPGLREFAYCMLRDIRYGSCKDTKRRRLHILTLAESVAEEWKNINKMPDYKLDKGAIKL